MQNNQPPHGSCPHIGLNYDKATYSDFPASNNVCYHAEPKTTPIYTHQLEFCLTNNFEKCPIYIAPKGNPFPSHLQHQAEKKTNYRMILLLGFCFALIIFVFLVLNWLDPMPDTDAEKQSFLQSQTKFGTELPTSTIIVVNLKEPTITFTPPLIGTTVTTPTLFTPTSSPHRAATPTEEKIFRLENLIGENPKFIIHRVNEGESLPLFADLYDSSVEIIRALNYGLPDILWTDQILIIPLNLMNISDIPPFIAYEVEKSMTFNEIATDFAIPIEDLLHYNNVQGDYPLHQGEWILLPQFND